MSSELATVEYIVDQLNNIGEISFRKMFGEYTLYNNGKVVALICDNQLFVKPTVAGRAYIGDVVEAPPYPGAKLAFLIDEQIEDGEWLSELIRITEKELPIPKLKKKKRKGAGQ